MLIFKYDFLYDKMKYKDYEIKFAQFARAEKMTVCSIAQRIKYGCLILYMNYNT